MSKIDGTARLATDAINVSAGTVPRNLWAERIVSERIARAEKADPLMGPGILIIPAVIGLLALGWLLPVVSIVYLAAPVVALVLCVMDRFRAPNLTDVWHGR